MNLLLDMNISPRWAAVLNAGGHHAVQWSDVGDPAAPDSELFAWGTDNDYIVFTADLILATSSPRLLPRHRACSKYMPIQTSRSCTASCRVDAPFSGAIPSSATSAVTVPGRRGTRFNPTVRNTSDAWDIPTLVLSGTVQAIRLTEAA